jgi:hypothetical protein
MKHKKFDDIIRDKLSNFEVNQNSDAWDLFEDARAARESGTPELDNHTIDEIAFDRLHQLKVPYEAAHWQQMNQRLKEEFSLTYKIYRYKLVEISVVLLAIFTVINYWPEIGSFPIRFGEPKQNYIKIAEKPIEAKMFTASQKEQAASPLEQLQNNVGKPTTKTYVDLDYTLDIPFTKEVLGTSSTDEEYNQEMAYSKKPKQTRITLPLSKIPFSPVYSDPYDIFNRIDQQSTASAIPTLNLLQTQFVNSEVALPAIIASTKRNSQLRIGMFGSSNFNSVQTTANDQTSFESFSRNGIGYGGGLTVGWSSKRWEFELGLIYTAIQYSPWILEIQGSFKEGFDTQGLKTIELNTVSVPLNIRYNYIYHSKWRLYTIIGITGHVAVQNNQYTADDASEFYNDGRSAVRPEVPVNQSYRPEIESRFDSENLSKGWFEGGTLEENYYFTGNVGFGLEYFFNNKWSVFAQPTYLHSIDYFKEGFGPNRDKINSINVLMGVKVNLID